ncbi:monothiol bacilliredoxin BrxC family protein, partial [Acinetobacter baumannii]
MKWNQLTQIGQLALIREQSYTRSQVIFKHSTRCSISS